MYFALLAAIAGLILMGLRFRGGLPEPGQRRGGPVALGATSIIPFLAMAVVASVRAPLPLFFGVEGAFLAIYSRFALARGWGNSTTLACFLIGLYGGYATFSLLALRAVPVLIPVTATVDGVCLALLWRGLRPEPAELHLSPT